MYTIKGRIGYSECGKNWRLTLPGLIDRLQDCSTMQSEDLGMGEAFVMEHGAAWILASWDIKLFRFPSHGEQVETSTWPYDFNRLFGFRNHIMKAEDGEVLAAADSQWFYFDFARKRPVRIPEIVVNGYENSFAEKLPYDFSSRKIPLPESFEEKEGFVVRKMDIDTNDHVNNAVYAAFALDYLPPVERLKEIRIEYVKAAVLSDRIIPAVYSGEERTVLNLKGEDGKPFVVIEARER